MSDIVKFQVSIAGYSGPAITLICAFSTADNVLVIAEEAALEEVRREGFGMVTNLDLPAVDMRFDDSRIADSITQFFQRESQDTLDLIDALTRHSPSQAITKDGFDDKGPRYRLAPEISNGNIAVLAACNFAKGQSPIGNALDMMSSMMDLYSITTI